VPRFGGTDRLAHGVAYAIEVFDQLGDVKVFSQQAFVAHKKADDIGFGVSDADGVFDLCFVALHTAIQPEPQGDLDAGFLFSRQAGNLPQIAQGRVGAYRYGLARQQGKVFPQLGKCGSFIQRAVLMDTVGGEGKALNPFGPGRFIGGLVHKGPQRQGRPREQGGHDHAGKNTAKGGTKRIFKHQTGLPNRKYWGAL